jgi:hypothetical protein
MLPDFMCKSPLAKEIASSMPERGASALSGFAGQSGYTFLAATPYRTRLDRMVNKFQTTRKKASQGVS